MKTDLQPIRQKRLKDWFSERPIPRKESSYISQLMTGRTAFGQRAARRIEKDYEMPDGYLDEPYVDEQKPSLAAVLDFRKLRLLELADRLPDAEVDQIIKLMEEKEKFYEAMLKEYLIKSGLEQTKK